MRQNLSLEPQAAVIVTGASGGIGRALARVAARDNSAVLIVGRSRTELLKTAAEVQEAGGRPHVLDLDLTSDAALEEIDDLLKQHGLFCDVLVNSAGHGLRGPAVALGMEDQLSIIDLNVRGLTRLSLHYLPGMVSRRRGGIINFSSVASFTAGPYMSLYYASKSFVRSFSASLHQEVKRSGVTVTCVCPGPVRTGFFESASAKQARLFHLLPKLEPDFVADRAWRGFRSGRRLVVPGLSAKLCVAAAVATPPSLMLPLLEMLQRSGNDPCSCGSGKKYKKCCGK